MVISIKMKINEALQSLANHSNLPDPSLPIEKSFLGCLWLSDKNEFDLAFETHVEDILHCLNIANNYYNGPNPNDREGPADHSKIDKIAYLISGIISGGLEYHIKWTRAEKYPSIKLNALECCIFKISYAWDSLLASDMSDLLEGFEYFD